MRDVDRLREKTEISLDDRQIAGLALGALVLLSGVFVLGLLLGKHLAAQAQPAPAVETAAAAVEAVVDRKPPPAPPPIKTAEPAPVKEDPPPAVPAPKQTAVIAPPPKDLGDYTVQVGASQDRVEAQRLEQRARTAGLKPYVIEADLGEKGTWYRVRVGAFKDKDSAGRFRRDVERELRSAAVVMSTH